MRENKLVNYSIIFIALVVLGIVLKEFQNIFRPMAIGLLLAFLLVPLAKLSRKKKIPAWITFSTLFVAIFLIFNMLISLVNVESLNLSNAIPEFQERILADSHHILSKGSQFGLKPNAITPEKLSAWIAKGITTGIAVARSIFSETLLAIILLMFILQSRKSFLHNIHQRFGEKEVDRMEATFEKIEGDIIAYFGTKTLMSLGTAIGTGLILLLFKAKFIMISMLIIFVLNYIPVIGSLIAVLILLLLYGLTFGATATLGWLFLCLMIVQILFGSVLEPKMAGDKLNISPILIIISLYLWGWIWGVIGMLLSVPFTLIILISAKHIRTMNLK